MSGAQRAQMSLSSNDRHPAKGSASPERRDESYQCWLGGQTDAVQTQKAEA